MRFTVLGCGSSAGVPMIGCNCGVCTSNNPKNRRSRVSVLVETQGRNLLIDTSPDLRQQALANDIRRVDAVIYSHDHADHIMGIDELRSFNYLSSESMPVYGDMATLSSLRQRFAYAFQPKPENVWFRPSLVPHIIAETGPAGAFSAHGVEIGYFRQLHGRGTTLGFRIGDFAYSTDTDGLEEHAYAALSGVKVWLVDCLRYEKAHSHAHLELTLGWIARVKPGLAILTHMGHEFDYDTLRGELPPGVVPGFDGLSMEL